MIMFILCFFPCHLASPFVFSSFSHSKLLIIQLEKQPIWPSPNSTKNMKGSESFARINVSKIKRTCTSKIGEHLP
jgi:hypothetical protein